MGREFPRRRQSLLSLRRRPDEKAAGGRRGNPGLGARAALQSGSPMSGEAGSGETAVRTNGNGRGNGASKLPRGAHRLPRDVVAENQRSRLLAGVARAVARRGYAGLVVEDVVREAGVSRTTFYENFDNKQECVRVAHGEAFDRLTGRIFRACAAEIDWPRRLAAAVRAAICLALEAPEEARLLLYESLGSDPELAAHVLASNEHLIGLLRAGREHSPHAGSLPELTERALIGAATSIVGNRLIQGQADRLRAVEPELVQLMLIPYVGGGQARRLAGVSA